MGAQTDGRPSTAVTHDGADPVVAPQEGRLRARCGVSEELSAGGTESVSGWLRIDANHRESAPERIRCGAPTCPADTRRYAERL